MRFSRFGSALTAAAVVLLLVGLLSGCHKNQEITYPAGYREFAYVSNTGSNTVTVLDVVNLRQDRTLSVGSDPTGVTANPVRHEVYVVNSGSGNVSVINTLTNAVAATIPVRSRPYFIDVDRSGARGYVANSGSNDVSVLDLAERREIARIPVGKGPGLARISPDGNSLVVTNRVSGTVSIANPHTMKVRNTFGPCPGATDAVILPNSTKAFIACSGGHQIMVIGLAQRGAKGAEAQDQLLSLLDVGKTPVQLALKPDGGEIFASNFDSGTISEIATPTLEVGGAYVIGYEPSFGIVSGDNSLLFVSNFGGGWVGVYSIDDGRVVASVHVGEGPDAEAFASSGRLLFVVDAQSGDVAVIRATSNPPSLLTLLPVGQKPSGIAVVAYSR